MAEKASDKGLVADKKQSSDRMQALDAALAQIEKQFGKGSIMRLGESAVRAGISTIPTGALALDIALGVGGVPKGRVVEIFGPAGWCCCFYRCGTCFRPCICPAAWGKY